MSDFAFTVLVLLGSALSALIGVGLWLAAMVLV